MANQNLQKINEYVAILQIG